MRREMAAFARATAEVPRPRRAHTIYHPPRTRNVTETGSLPLTEHNAPSCGTSFRRSRRVCSDCAVSLLDTLTGPISITGASGREMGSFSKQGIGNGFGASSRGRRNLDRIVCRATSCAETMGSPPRRRRGVFCNSCNSGRKTKSQNRCSPGFPNKGLSTRIPPIDMFVVEGYRSSRGIVSVPSARPSRLDRENTEHQALVTDS
jgi:hypothetical protein